MSCACCGSSCASQTCCSGGLPSTLYLVISGTSGGPGPDVDGTYPLQCNATAVWTFGSPATNCGSPPPCQECSPVGANGIQATFTCSQSASPPAAGFELQVSIETCVTPLGGCLSPPACSPGNWDETGSGFCFQVLGSGSTPGTWSTATCSPPQWQSNSMAPNTGSCGTSYSGVTFTIHS